MSVKKPTKAARKKPARPAPKPKAGRSKAAVAARRVVFRETFLTNGHNATHAAYVAGFTGKQLARMGWGLLQEPAIKAAIAARMSEVAALAEMTTETWARELRSIAFARPSDLYDAAGNLIPIHVLPPHVQAALSSVKFKNGAVSEWKLNSKNTALDLMARHLGLLRTRIELTGADGGAVKIEDVTPIEAARRIAFVLTLGAQAAD